MSVYTTVSKLDLSALLTRYEIGVLQSYQGINQGIENTNYFVTTDKKKCILTIFEELSQDDVDYFLALMQFMSEAGLACARPIVDRNGIARQCLLNKPAVLVEFLTGRDVLNPSLEQCYIAGREVARFHLFGKTFGLKRKMVRSMQWRISTAEKVIPYLDETSRCFLTEEIRWQQDGYAKFRKLPDGVIHADLFRDNILFDGNTISGIIDFYYSCDGPWIYDLAVMVNDWCFDHNQTLNQDCLEALLSGYCKERKVSAVELALWPYVLRFAALRFWLSRLKDSIIPRQGEITHTKNPDIFYCILKHHRSAGHNVLKMWEAIVPRAVLSIVQGK